MTVNSHCRLVVFIYLLYTPAGLHEESRDGRGGREADGILRVITSCVKKKGRFEEKTAYAPSNEEMG